MKAWHTTAPNPVTTDTAPPATATLGRVPRLRQYYQRTPTSRRPSRRASFSFAWRYHRSPCFAPSGGGTSRGRDCCLPRPSVPPLRGRRRDLPGSWATPARMPRSPTPAEPRTPDRRGARGGAFRSCHSVGFRDAYGFRGSITRPARLPVYASQPGSPPVHATLGSGWSVNLGRSGLSPAGSLRRFPS